MNRVRTALTIAGSDSGGGAGIQADLRAFHALGVHGSSVITAVTAQNTLGVVSVYPVGVDCIESQLQAVLSDIGADAVKTGMLPDAESVALVARLLREYGTLPLVVDPVMSAKGGATLTPDKAIRALAELLFPLAELITPNVPEAEALVGGSIRSREDMQRAAVMLHRFGSRYVLLKGGHLGGDTAPDLLYDGSRFIVFESARIDNPHTHGTGCTLASTIAGLLAKGEAVTDAAAKAKAIVTEAIRNGYPLGKGVGPVRIGGSDYVH